VVGSGSMMAVVVKAGVGLKDRSEAAASRRFALREFKKARLRVKNETLICRVYHAYERTSSRLDAWNLLTQGNGGA
jgi:hypothetical protein